MSKLELISFTVKGLSGTFYSNPLDAIPQSIREKDLRGGIGKSPFNKPWEKSKQCLKND